MEPQANPALLQKGDPSRAPLFLIHGPGGGVHGYSKLEPIGRPVYALHNPWLGSTTRWAGGAMLFVDKYIELIKTVVRRGDVLVGGWSSGGQMSIDIGRVLAQDRRSKVRVVGIVMIDSLYPDWGPADAQHGEMAVDLLLGPCPKRMREPTIRCMLFTRQDSLDWARLNSRSREDELDGIEAEEPPPAVQLHATKLVPVEKSEHGAKAMADFQRHARGGWALFPHDFIVATWDLSGHHFDLFERNQVSWRLESPVEDTILMQFAED